MSTVLGLDCDVRFCGNRYVSTKASDTREVREEAKRNGWSHFPHGRGFVGVGDYCPTHTRQEARS